MKKHVDYFADACYNNYSEQHKTRTTQEPRFDKLPMATLGDIVHRHEESPNPGTQAPEAPEEPGMDEIEEEIE